MNSGSRLINLSAFTTSNKPNNKFYDFRKITLLHEVESEVNNYSKGIISTEEFNEMRAEIFIMKEEMGSLKERQSISEFDNDINNMKWKEVKRQFLISNVFSWLLLIVQAYGYSLDYENLKIIFESFLEFIKTKL